jgi:hypothetical protein
MSCTVCNHPERLAIDAALLARTATLAQLSEQHHLSTSALHRHKQHLLKKMTHVRSRFQDILSEGWLVILNSFLELIIRAAQTAGAEGNTRLVLQAVRQGTAIIKFIHKRDATLAPDTVHRLLSSPEWSHQEGLLPTDLKFFLGSRQALAQNLSASCPEPASEQDKAAAADLGDIAALEDLAHLNSDQLLYLLSEMFPSLGAPESEPHPHKREKGGKKPKKIPATDNNIEQYQQDNLCEKNIGKFPPAVKITDGPRPAQPSLKGHNVTLLSGPKASESTSSWIQALDEGSLDVNLLHAIGAGRPVDLDQYLAR